MNVASFQDLLAFNPLPVGMTESLHPLNVLIP